MNGERRFLFIIAALGLALLAQSLRFSAPEFRPWEVLVERDGYLFQPGRRVEMREIGDLGYRSWVRALQHPRPVVFTTDSHGFRNPREIERPAIVVVGDSYVVGSGVSDHETLSERLSARLGEPVYNYGQAQGGGPQLFLVDPRFQKAPPRWVVFAPVQRLLRTYTLDTIGRWPLWENAPVPLDEQLDGTVSRFFTRLNRDNGLAVAARYAGMVFTIGSSACPTPSWCRGAGCWRSPSRSSTWTFPLPNVGRTRWCSRSSGSRTCSPGGGSGCSSARYSRRAPSIPISTRPLLRPASGTLRCSIG